MPRATRLTTTLLAALLLGGGALAAIAETPIVTAKRNYERTTFTDAEIIDGFMKTAFGAEYQLAGRVDRIRKFQKPVRVFINGAARPDRNRQIEHITSDIARHIRHLDLALTPQREGANLIVNLVPERDFDREIRKLYGTSNARKIRKSLDPQCLSGFRKNDDYEIEHSEVILTVDNSEFVFLDCAYEEILQSLGPINDTTSVPWTMFNDDVSMGFFDTYDRYLMNILYDPRIKAGMSADEVRPLLPAILKDVRAKITVHSAPQRKTPH
ncbi:conserved hypothetical protein [Afipia carboxidovorans OM5]|uniref:DUF2927 domain-containing protein n=1 Tax=Afipia carboxidovorans (strain ATCC 49405 / DSM 1227 / KCTC 32145 / OM5) TaxID=504832 RepID=B6JII5_AFIC5|nr:DUF2927 domain-containing protein [Afipia carboxidovorans]ACI94230.1 conserved hypothetical protein [Afipia carboxidovorans OM5]AEI02122.1 hypothetical protein OCA4_c09760 [Afipia carboxidovorans OM4]AEI05698.1 hypothetical protein OCA5_c09770 [Afipia carboxidovorans OM5]